MKSILFFFLISLIKPLEIEESENKLYKKLPINQTLELLESENITKEECEVVINSIISLLDRYVFLDITKNPPQTKKS